VNASTLGAATTTTGLIDFDDRDPKLLSVSRAAGTTGGSLRISEPQYGFHALLKPKIRGTLEVDVGVYDDSWSTPEYTVSALRISSDLVLPLHAGTTSRHDYEVFGDDAPPAAGPKPHKKQADPNAPVPKQPAPAPKKPVPKQPIP
jgi:hypothetical protein